ncbi:MAG: glycosyltransferase family 39 protein [Bacteroidales bacterium]|nr:glycosyltransferase family 39 protein [Bacteroidales bacterium]
MNSSNNGFSKRLALFFENPNNLRIVFYLSWFIISIIQARFTGLWNDEAYYWEYSRDLEWGYFDHPPMIGVVIKFGYLLFKNELGVRLFIVIFSTATIFIIEKTLQPSNLKLYYLIILSIGLLHLGSIIAVPDILLIFLSATFLWFYKKYNENDNLVYAVLIALNIALLLLSKYHGLTVIGLIVLSNLKLLGRKSFWLIVFLSIVFLIPHVLWQYNHGWPSISYHLFERSPEAYRFTQTLNFIIGQLLIPGPIIGIFLIYYSFRYTPKDSFERSLKFILIGTYTFFFLMSFRTRIEANWTVTAIIPMIYLAYKEVYLNARAEKILKYSFLISLPVIILIRIYLIFDFFPTESKFNPEFHKWANWATQVKDKAGDLPVVFFDSYQKPSKYEFYAQSTSFTINSPTYRKTLFDYRTTENDLQGKDVYVSSESPLPGADSLLIPLHKTYIVLVKNFRSFGKIRIDTKEKEIITQPGSPIYITLNFRFNEDGIIDLEANPDLPSYLHYEFFKDGKKINSTKTNLLIENKMLNASWYEKRIVTPLEKGTYDLFISIKTAWFPPTINSRRIKVEVF